MLTLEITENELANIFCLKSISHFTLGFDNQEYLGKSLFLDTLLSTTCNLRLVEDVVVLDNLKLSGDNGHHLADPVKLSVHVNLL